MLADNSAQIFEQPTGHASSHEGPMARLLAVAGHDLRQPLQVAMMSVDRALGDGVSPTTERRLLIAVDAMARLGRELSDIARLSQKGAGLRPRRRTLQLADVFAQLEQDWAFYADACRTKLNIQGTSLLVRSDSNMLQSILRNLVGNAIKFSGPGGQVDVNCRVEGRSVVIEVRDNGSGIPPARLTRIFDAFERGDQGSQHDGLGLGLHIVRQMADLLRHPVSVRSIERVGTTFAIELPRHLSSRQA